MLDALIDRLHSLIPMPSSEPDVPVLDQQTLDDAVEDDDGVIVLFYADWCGFCRTFLPTYEDAADELPMPVAAANISDYSDPRWSRYDVDAVPTVVAFEDGEEIVRADARPGRGLSADDLARIASKVPA